MWLPRLCVSMNFRTALIVSVLLVAVAAVGGVAATDSAAQTNDDTEVNTNETADNATPMQPGARMAGVIGTHRAEYDSDFDRRGNGVRIARAASDEARADIVAERFGELEARLARHEQQHESLQAARERGDISEDTYRGRVARLAAEQARTEHCAEQLNATAHELPEELREERNINLTAIDQLRTEARTLGGEETAAIARAIARDVRNPMAGNMTRGPRAAGERGPHAERGPGVERGPSNETRGGSGPGDHGPGGDRGERGPGGGSGPSGSSGFGGSGGGMSGSSSGGGMSGGPP